MSIAIDLDIESQNWPIAGQFRIARGQKSVAELIEVRLHANGHTGHGECVPYARYNESIKSVSEQINSIKEPLQTAFSRKQLQDILPAGAARNAIDCALWDLKAQILQKPVSELANMEPPTKMITACTLSLATAQQMAKAASELSDYPLLKVKLAGNKEDISRIRAIYAARPDAKFILDGNEGFDMHSLQALCDQIDDLPIAAIEQPLPAKDDQDLQHINTRFDLCADESLHTCSDLPNIARKYQMINIKLDKTGGLTEALRLCEQAKLLGLKIMVGCMVSTSLSMLPALLVAGKATLVDLDGPLLLKADRPHGLQYSGAHIMPQHSKLWGYPRLK